MKAQQEIQNGIDAHARWKEHLRYVIETGKSQFTVESVCQDDQCPLGKWLHSLQGTPLASARWQCVRATHADFHREAGRILEHALAGRKQDARAAFSYSSPFTGISAKLTAEMTAWKREVA